ncbi:glycosyl transferase GT11 family [Butyrivibrio proteoclasticus B316]|uniref:Glycosyl transferase GT11 family n=1 Tax=Butyrivibrio proteoclasticus (strain ATCC 51982 / DSM 14932 / B316) TaxID=515622 RepID=E0RVU2_BUTPB|nr:alpha-1,2-fucosyltransferase [Butyrivibrio proteoclasticus]ADL35250.1 glycosyl transferase GT11 family [Butyrivibrio proteoclasticus B316]
MVIVKIAGGLGNQMQQYSVYRKLLSLGKEAKLDLSWFSPKVQEKMLAKRDFELPLFVGIPYEEASKEELDKLLAQSFMEKVKGKIRRKLGKQDSDNENVFLEKEMYHPEIFDFDNKYIDGYFACQKYYGDIMPQLRELFVFPEHSIPELQQRNMVMALKMDKENSVSVHIRRGDYLDPENFKVLGNIATEQYYNSAMKYFMDKYPDTHFYIFTSDHEYARENFKDESLYTIIDWNTGRDSVQDLMLMSHCKGNICANSTFSFWGARLNKRPDHEVIRTFTMRNNQHCEPDIMHDYWDGWILMDKDGKIV